MLFAQHSSAQVPVTYRLPPNPGETYLVTLAVTDISNPGWIVSTFVAGQPRTVTAENGGKFTETWDGLDENFMPVPPGKYSVKGIYSPAEKWKIDGEYHAITPVFNGGASKWLPPRDHDQMPVPFGGDPVLSPLADVDVGSEGVAVFYYRYLENGTNLPMFDLNKPIHHDQFLGAFNSGGAGGGPCVATDGETVWAYCAEGGPRYLYRADRKPFGKSPGANRRYGRFTDGYVTALTAIRDSASGKSFLYAAQRGEYETTLDRLKRKKYRESTTNFVDQITVHDGETGNVLATRKISRPQGLAISGNKLLVLHKTGEEFLIATIPLTRGIPAEKWKSVPVPDSIAPADMEADSKGRIYLSDTAANHAYQLSPAGKILRKFGELDAQKPGTYDRETLMSPGKLAVWTDSTGTTRLLIVDNAGPNRTSEWNADDGTLIRDFMSHQTKANNGFAVDPDDASLIYLPTHKDWLTRYKIDYDTGEWKADAVWPDVPIGMRTGLSKPDAVRTNGRLYLASTKTLAVFRLTDDGSRWAPSASLIREGKNAWFWNDANDNGEIDDFEKRPTTLPGQVVTYHGQRWLPDLSYLSPAQGGKDLWRFSPDSFDSHGNPVFTKWEKVLTDPVFEAREKGPVNALYGGNELAERFESDWMQADGSPHEGYYVQARAHDFNANEGGQHKITRYVPDGEGGYKMKWRVGRSVLGSPERGELKGGMRLYKPINGILTVIDQSRSGLFLYTDDGLYIDTLFPPGSTQGGAGIYRQPGEFFAGTLYPDPDDGSIYYGSGKYTPLVYSMKNWSLTENPVERLTTLPDSIHISASQISSPPEKALAIRGGAGKTRFARFSPAIGGAALDGSLSGWESADTIEFSGGKNRTVEVRGLYDPETLYLRWHVRTGADFTAKPLPPLERLLTHDTAADTLGLYFQGNPNPKNTSKDGRPGDVRFVLGIFDKEGETEPAAVAMYPSWSGKNATPQTYRSPVGEVSFENVGPIEGIRLGHLVDEDNKGFVIAAAIPRSAIPAIRKPFSGDFRTLVNFDANLGGHNKFWWADSDGSASRETYDEPSEARLYPGSWAPLAFKGLGDGVTVRNWQILGPFGGSGAQNFKDDPQHEMKDDVRKFFEAAVFPPDEKLDFTATYEGQITRGYWADPGKVKWKPTTTEPLDTRAIIGRSAQIWYGATWIHAPQATELDFAIQGHPMTPARWFLNGEQIILSEEDLVRPETGHHLLREATRSITLKPGWNQVHFRAYNYGYTPFRQGLVLRADESKLWPLRLSGTPPSPE